MNICLSFIAAILDCYNNDNPTFTPLGQTDALTLQCLQEWTPIVFASEDSNFDRPHSDYTDGFGSVQLGSYWLGNQVLYTISAQRSYNLRIDLWNSDGVYTYAEYKTVWIRDSAQGFQIELRDFLGGSAGDGGLYSGAAFHAKDLDNAEECASNLAGGWWFGTQTLEECMRTKLTGNYTSVDPALGIHWGTENVGSSNSTRHLVQAAMRIRPDLSLTIGTIIHKC